MLEKRIFGIMTLVVGILAVIGLSMIACSNANSNNPSAFVGKWELKSGGFPFDKAELFKDGTGIVDNGGFSWKVVDKRLVITHPWFALACDYKISGSTITLTTDDGDIGTFVKRNRVNETAVTATPTVNAKITLTTDVNFRTEPSTGDNIIRQLLQGDTVTLTGKTSGSWTQIKHGSDTGWIRTEYLNK
jgi:hypothetical protein